MVALRFFRPAWRRVLGSVLVLLSMAVTSTSWAAAGASAEYQLKAVFLFNFAQFVDWPARSFPDAISPIVIGVVGEDPFGAYLDGVVQGEKIGERPVVVRRYALPDDIDACHILFISRSEAGQLDRILTTLRGRTVLTVGEGEGFNRQGGIVQFTTENSKIRLGINVVAAKAAELKISSKLLAHATIVPSGKHP